MPAGDYDRRLRLLRPAAQKTALNTTQKAWAPFARAWGKRTPVSDGERVRAEQAGATFTDRFRIPWAARYAALSVLNQLECEGVRYAIRGVKMIGRREALEITALALDQGPAA